MKEPKYVRERKTVLIRRGNIDDFVRCRGLQLEIEGTAKAFAKRESPRFVDPATERRVNHQLHSAALVEETFRDNRCLCGNRSQDRPAGNDVLYGLLRAGPIESAFLFEPTKSRSGCAKVPERRAIDDGFRHVGDLLAQLGYLLRKLAGAGGGFSAPERNVRSRAMRIFHKDAPRLHTTDPPGAVSKEHDVAAQTLHG